MNPYFATAVFALVTCIAPASVAVASERVDICAQYSNTGKSYHVQAISLSGSQLNQATHTFDYNSLSHYIVIFWDQRQASIIEMQGIFVGPTPFPSGGIDQLGRTWEISSYSSLTWYPSRPADKPRKRRDLADDIVRAGFGNLHRTIGGVSA